MKTSARKPETAGCHRVIQTGGSAPICVPPATRHGRCWKASQNPGHHQLAPTLNTLKAFRPEKAERTRHSARWMMHQCLALLAMPDLVRFGVQSAFHFRPWIVKPSRFHNFGQRPLTVICSSTHVILSGSVIVSIHSCANSPEIRAGFIKRTRIPTNRTGPLQKPSLLSLPKRFTLSAF